MKKCIMKMQQITYSLWNKLNKDISASGTLEMVLIIVNNPFTSSTYILSY